MIIVSAERTPMTAEEAASTLTLAWPELDREQAALFLALCWIETRQGDSVVCHNPGNLSARDPTYPGRAWRPPWFAVDENSPERMKRLHQLMLEGKAPKAFRAYANLATGFADFAELLQSSPYTPLRAAASSGDVARFRAELARRYSKDYGPEHDRALAQFQGLFRPLVASLPAPSRSTELVASGSLAPVLLGFLLLKGFA